MGEGFTNWLELVFSTQPFRLFFRFLLSIVHWLVMGGGPLCWQSNRNVNQENGNTTQYSKATIPLKVTTDHQVYHILRLQSNYRMLESILYNQLSLKFCYLHSAIGNVTVDSLKTKQNKTLMLMLRISITHSSKYRLIDVLTGGC